MESIKRILAIAKKEIIVAYNTALGYTFVILFMFVENLLFFFGFGGNSFWERKNSDLGFFFLLTPFLMIIFVAAIGMKIWSEEKESGTWEVLFTLPFREWEIVIGKYISSCFYVLVALMSTIFIPLTVMIFGEPDFGIIFSGYIGVYLLGISFVSIIMYFSLFFQTQIGSFLFGFFVLSILYAMGSQRLIDVMGSQSFLWLNTFSYQKHFESFRLGIFDPRDFYFFISISLVFLSLATIHLREKR